MRTPSWTWCLIIPFCLLAPTRVSAQDDDLQEKIDRAIDRGVKNLKQIGADNGMWAHQFFPTGMSALAAWTLLESGVKPNDVVVQKAAAQLRKETVLLTNTYSQALAILFFDRLGDPGDEALIQALGVRLLAGQKANGSWTYNSSWGDVADRAWLQKHIEEASQEKKEPSAEKRKLYPQIRMQIEKLQRTNREAYFGDNSNTQFAMLALWVARRHGLPVDEALARVETRFRTSQVQGGWGYQPGTPENSPRATMTCAGLLGIAIGQGLRPKKVGQGEKLLKEPIVKAGYQLLGEVLKNPDGEAQKSLLQKPGNLNYFLFSLERMAVVYDVKKIGDKDWYTWGAKILVDKQGEDGSWAGEYGPADTCFALLFLKRANVAEDLMLNLNPLAKPTKKKKLKDSDPKEGPFDLPDKEKKKKIKIRPKDSDKESRLSPFRPELLFARAIRGLPFRDQMADVFPTWASVPPTRRWSW